MKQLGFLIVFLGIVLMPFSAKAGLAVVKVNGMVCDFCAQSLEKVFMEEEGVEGLTVDLDTQEVTIGIEDGQSLSKEKIEELIVYSGYAFIGVTYKEGELPVKEQE